MTKKESLVAIIMGSESDWPIMKHVAEVLDDFNISYIPENSSIVGDINNDLEVNVLDVVLLGNMILGSEIDNYATADINSDSEINIQDVILLLNMILDS